MELNHISYQGPQIDDPELLERVPESLASLLRSLNGFIQFGGGLHVRGAFLEPMSVSDLFPNVDEVWIPFAEDCVGDQFLLRNREVLRLSAETGDIDAMGLSLGDFIRSASADPIEFLALEPLLQFQEDNGALPDGHLIHAYPPFCTKEAAQGVVLNAVQAWELHEFHSEFAKALPSDGKKMEIKIRG